MNGSLHITNAHARDSGMYTCTADNTFGENSASARLTVTSSAATSPRVFMHTQLPIPPNFFVVSKIGLTDVTLMWFPAYFQSRDEPISYRIDFYRWVRTRTRFLVQNGWKYWLQTGTTANISLRNKPSRERYCMEKAQLNLKQNNGENVIWNLKLKAQLGQFYLFTGQNWMITKVVSQTIFYCFRITEKMRTERVIELIKEKGTLKHNWWTMKLNYNHDSD